MVPDRMIMFFRCSSRRANASIEYNEIGEMPGLLMHVTITIKRGLGRVIGNEKNI